MATFNANFKQTGNFKATLKSKDGMKSTFGEAQIIEAGHYASLPDKPSINGETLIGDKSFEDLGDHVMTNTEIKAIFDRIFKGGN